MGLCADFDEDREGKKREIGGKSHERKTGFSRQGEVRFLSFPKICFYKM